MNKLPRELLLEIIAKQNSAEYLSIEECSKYFKKYREKIYELCLKELKLFFCLSEENLKIQSIRIVKSELEFSDDFIKFYLGYRLDENPQSLDECNIFFRNTNVIIYFYGDTSKILEIVDICKKRDQESNNFFVKLLDLTGEDNLCLNL
jgi:hypothetical protein